MARRLVTYDDLNSLATASSPIVPRFPRAPTANGKQAHWTPDGEPISASASRKYRRTMQMLQDGEIAAAEAALQADGMGPAKESVQMREALAWAKRKEQEKTDDEAMSVFQNGAGKGVRGARAGPSTSNGVEDGEAGEIDDEDDDEDGYDGEYAEDDAYNDNVEWQPGTALDWQGLTGSHAPQGRAVKRQKQLTHAEIWDDSALVDAWDAAMEEYKLFDAQRTAHQSKQREQQNGQTGEVNREDGEQQAATRHSALWHDSPTAERSQAASTSATNGELERRKRQAKALLAQYPSTGENGGDAAAATATRDSAWHSARAVVAQTPNQVGSGGEADDGYAAEAAPEGRLSKEEVLQNLAMAWYYAGYYQALASQM